MDNRRNYSRFAIVRRQAAEPDRPASASAAAPTTNRHRATSAHVNDVVPTNSSRSTAASSRPTTAASVSSSSSSKTKHTQSSSDSDKNSTPRRTSATPSGNSAAPAQSLANSPHATHSPQVGGPPTLSQTALLGIIAGASVLGLLMIASGVWYCAKRRKQKRQENSYWGVRPNGKPSSMDGKLLASAHPQRLPDEKDGSISERSYELEKRSTGTLSNGAPNMFHDSRKVGDNSTDGSGGMWKILQSSDSEKRRKVDGQERLWDPPSIKEEKEKKERERLRMTLAAMDFGPNIKLTTPVNDKFSGIDSTAGVNGLGPNGWDRSKGQVGDMRPRPEPNSPSFTLGETKVVLTDGPPQDPFKSEADSTARPIKGRADETNGAFNGLNKKTDTIAGFMDAYGWDDEHDSQAPPLPIAPASKKSSLLRRGPMPLSPAASDIRPFPPSEVSTEYSVSEGNSVLADSSTPAGWLERSTSGMSTSSNGRRKAPPAPLDLSEHDQAERDLEDILHQLDPRSKRTSPDKTVAAAPQALSAPNAQPLRKVLSPVPEMPSPLESDTPLPTVNNLSPMMLPSVSSVQSQSSSAVGTSPASSSLKGKLKGLNALNQEGNKTYGSVAPPGRLAMGRGDSVYSYRVEEMGEYPNASSVGTPTASPMQDEFPYVPPARTAVPDSRAKDTNAKKRASSFYGLSYTRESVDIPPPPALPFPPPLSPFSTSLVASPALGPTHLPSSDTAPLTPTYARSQSAAQQPNSAPRGITVNTNNDIYANIGSALLSATSPSMQTDWTFGSSAPASPDPPTPDPSSQDPTQFEYPATGSHGSGKRERVGPEDAAKAGFPPLESMKVTPFHEVDRDSVYGVYDDYLTPDDHPAPPAARAYIR